MWLISREDYGDRYELQAWRSTREDAERWILENPPSKYDWLNLYELKDDGTVEHIEHYNHVPERYVGPVVRRRLDGWHERPGYYHRTPIDCIRPTWPHQRELTEDHRFWVVETRCCGTAHDHSTTEFMHCHCYGWLVLEGDPEAIDRFAKQIA